METRKMNLPCRIVFADDKVKEAFEELNKGKTEDKQLHCFLENAFKKIEKDSFSGIRIQKSRIPKIYQRKYNIDNLWKYNLPNGWRPIYSVGKKEVIIISIILEWFSHKDYEKRFGNV
jgi:Txe/YoeB family toxin of Txe-Axe toxin-antitoxin module